MTFFFFWDIYTSYKRDSSMLCVGVRFRSSTNGCATRSSEELKPRNLFDRTVRLLISSKKDMFERHVLTRDWGGGVAPVRYLPSKLRW